MVETRTYTVEELERTPPAGDVLLNDWELIDGKVVAVPPAGAEAFATVMRMASLIGGAVYENRRGVMYLGSGFKLFPDRETLLAPDVAFVRSERLSSNQRHRFLRTPPDLAVDVVPSFDAVYPALNRGLMYLDAGVRLVWLVDPTRLAVVVMAPDEWPVTLRAREVLGGGAVLPGFAVPVADVFR